VTVTDGRRMNAAKPAEAAALERRGSHAAGMAVYLAAALSLAAALIHLWVVPEHLREWWGHGAFFLALALAQGLGAALLLRWPDEQPLFLAGIFGNLAVIALYVVSRTAGVPFGPHAGMAEEMAGVLGLGATAAELGIVVALVTLLEGSWRGRTMNALLFVGALAWAARLLGIL
jgi:hypothetical protein